MAATKKSTAARAKAGAGTDKQDKKNKSTAGRAGSRKTASEGGRTKNSSGGRNRKTAEEVNTYRDQLAFETGITILVLCIAGIFFYLCYVGVCGKAGLIVTGLLFGIFGWLAWLLPVGMVVGYTFAVVNRGDKRVPRRMYSGIALLLCLESLIELLFPREILTEYYISNHVMHPGFLDSLYLSLEDVSQRGKASGGILGRLLGNALASFTGKWGAAVILFALVLLCLYIFYGLEMMGAIRRRNAYRQEMEKAYQDIRQEEGYQEPSYRMVPLNSGRRQKKSAGSGIQAIDLKAVGEKLDQIEREEQKAQRRILPNGGSRKTARQEDTPDGMQEIVARNAGEAEEPSPSREEPEKSQTAADTSERKEIARDISHIPIYREEMEQKFGKAGKASHREADLPPKKDGQKAKEKAAQAEDASQSAVFQALNESKQETQQKPYQFPPLDLLCLPGGSEYRISDDKLRTTAAKLQETLQSFNVDVQMGAVTCGPTVTRYEVLPAQGVRVNKITNLADDLKLSMAAPSIRIEAPIPGKAAVGIEVPNEEASSVLFRELLEGEAFSRSKSPVTFAVGKDIAGKTVVADIAKMPHLLIAGATGSGKSVCINTLIMSILYKSDPSDVKLIMIDPKVVELSVYNGIPHLFCPVVTDPKEAAAALNWAVREMMERYNKFKELGVRNMEGYNKKIKTVENAEKAGYEKMPILVIIVDEFADLMMVASKEVEDAVCRLAQLARAAGIHLILATQRPSVNVITGIIKANIPSRIAFSVSSAVDSRTIIDKGGAEKLLGKGDMLFFPSGYSEPVRLQGAFISDKEVSDVVDFLCDTNDVPVYNDKVTEILESPAGDTKGEEENKPDQDEYFEEAGRFVIESERAAAGQLQRRFSIGFNRAGRIIDQLHKAGVVGPAVGTKPRQVLMTMEQFENYLGLGGEDGTPIAEEEFQSMAQEFSDTEDMGEML